MIQEMQIQGVIEQSTSPCSLPILLVPKKNGETRFCIDFRRLNSHSRKDSIPIPRIDDMLDSLSGSSLFRCLDCASGYWQIEIQPEDKDKKQLFLQLLGYSNTLEFHSGSHMVLHVSLNLCKKHQLDLVTPV